jgi:hypothetical protein
MSTIFHFLTRATRRPTPILFLAILAILLAPPSTLSQREQERATIHLRIVGLAAVDLGEAKVEIFKSESGGRDLAARFKGNTALGVPFGIYKLRVYTRGFWSAEREVRVFQPEVWVVIQLEIGMTRREGGLRTFELSGSVKNMTYESEPIWLRLAGVHSGVTLDARVSTLGDFKMAGIPQGLYVLVTTQGDRILDTRPIQIPVTVRIEIDLANKNRN